jgi:acetylornithine aminotransferase
MTTSYEQRWSRTMMANYGTPPLALVRGAGTRVWDSEGREYLDLVAGIAVNALGHAHPAVVEAVAEQVARLGHTSNLVVNPPSLELAERLLGLLDPDGRREGRVFFASSGTEANETALKISRGTGRTTVVAAHGGFHGRTMGALSLTGQPKKRAPFEPLVPAVRFVPYADPSALAEGIDEHTAALFLEPVQGENGIVVPPTGYLGAARTATSAAGTLLVLDEVQTGIARTGAWFAHQHDGVAPDVVTLAKGLGGGLPISACIAFGPAAGYLVPGSHGATFGGNPVSAAAALAVLDTIEADGLVAHAGAQGRALAAAIEALEHPLVSHVRGRGLMLGVVLHADVSARVEGAARAFGLLVNAPVPDVVRLVPALILSDEDVALAVDRFAAALEAVAADLGEAPAGAAQ